jgi:predicted dehydrogenase
MKEDWLMSKHTRREFLEHSLLATAAAAAAATPAPSCPVLAADDSSSPNERLRIAVLGLRNRGQEHLEAYAKLAGCEVVAVVDPDEVIGQTKGVEPVEKATGKKPAFFTDLRRVTEDRSIDAVSIATPNHWHALAAIWAMQADKDVYLEKPVSHNVSEGRRIVQAARKYGKMVQTGTQGRSSKAVREAIEYVRAGQIGEVKLARGLCYKARGPIGARGEYNPPASVDYNLWLGPAPEKSLTRPKLHYDWHWQWDTGNGDLGNQGIHQMDIARWGLGVDNLGRSVTSYGGRLGYVDAGETANTQVSIHDFGDRRLVFEVRGLKTEGLYDTNVGVIFYGSKGYVVVPENYRIAFAFDPDGSVVKKFVGGGDNFENFEKAVRSRNVEDLNADILEGHLSSALCHLGNISYRLGDNISAEQAEQKLAGDREALATFERVVGHLEENGVDLKETPLRFGAPLTLDGRREVFTGELAAQANASLTREYRKPFVMPSETNV